MINIFIVLAIVASFIVVMIALNLRGKKPETPSLLERPTRYGYDFDIDVNRTQDDIDWKLIRQPIRSFEEIKKDQIEKIESMDISKEKKNELLGNLIYGVKKHAEKREVKEEFGGVINDVDKFKDAVTGKKDEIEFHPLEQTPEDYFRSLVFKDGKWQKP